MKPVNLIIIISLAIVGCFFISLSYSNKGSVGNDLSEKAVQGSPARRLHPLDRNKAIASLLVVDASSKKVQMKIIEASKNGDDHLCLVIKELLEDDEQQLLKSLATLDVELNYDAIGYTLLNYYKDNDLLAEGLGAFDTIGVNPSLAAPLLHFFVSESWEQRPDETFTWALEHGDTEGIHEAMYILGNRQGGSDNPSERMASVLESDLPEDVQAVFLKGVVNEWIYHDIDEALNYILEFPSSPLIDRTIYSSLDRLATLDPPGAMTWAQDISDSNLSISAIEEVSIIWRKSDPAGFKKWENEQ